MRASDIDIDLETDTISLYSLSLFGWNLFAAGRIAGYVWKKEQEKGVVNVAGKMSGIWQMILLFIFAGRAMDGLWSNTPLPRVGVLRLNRI